MNQRILRTVAAAVASLAVAVPAATASGNSNRAYVNGKLREIGAWAVPTKTKHVHTARLSKLGQQLVEIGAWALPIG
jgi:hypothetical protein